MAAIFWSSGHSALSLENKLPVPRGPSGNTLHVVTFGILAFLIARALDGGGAAAGLGTSAGKAALVLAVVYGLSDEIHQFFTPGRTCSAYDVVVDALGACAALTVPRPAGPGRPLRWAPALLILAAAVGTAIVAGMVRLPADRVIADLLAACGFAGS